MEPEDEADDVCGACNGTGWVPRDPDIGTEQECFVCNGTGKLEDEL
jgi:DnaJ-class molecular chaperone